MADNDQLLKPDTSERYLGACATSNLRFDPERRGPAHVLVAAAKVSADPDLKTNEKRSAALGQALLRLVSEYDGTQHPLRPTEEQIDAVASSYAKTEMRDGQEVEIKWRTRRLAAQRQTWNWYVHELELMLSRLKTMPAVREALTVHAEAQGMDDPAKVAAETIGWWLYQKCGVCNGNGGRMIHHRYRVCSKCQGSALSPIPNGMDGRRMASYMDACVAKARGLIGKGLRKMTGRA